MGFVKLGIRNWELGIGGWIVGEGMGIFWGIGLMIRGLMGLRVIMFFMLRELRLILCEL